MTRKRIYPNRTLTKKEKARRYRRKNRESANLYAARYREENREVLRKKALGFHANLRGDLAVSLKRTKAPPPDTLEIAQALKVFEAKGGEITHLKEEVVPLNLKIKTKYD